MKKRFPLCAIFLMIGVIAFPLAVAAQSFVNSSLEIQGIGTNESIVPFWMRSNQFGNVPNEGLSAAAVGSLYKNYADGSSTTFLKNLDWAFGFQGRANTGKKTNLLLIEAYAKLKLNIFEFKAGRSKDIMGIAGDQSLSSGNFSVSGNALGIPKLELSVPEYFVLPIFEGLFALKGQVAHGSLGRTEVSEQPLHPIRHAFPITYFHQKSLYGRIGKANSKLKAYAGFNHQVYWGNEKDVYGTNFTLNTSQTYFHVLVGKAYENKGKILSSKIGNQIGSIDLGFEYDFKNFKLNGYRQNFYDVGALSKLANIADGLNGISLENKIMSKTQLTWKKILFEFLHTKNQAGYPDSKPTKSGDEDYYNNDYYKKGWSYYGLGLGTPFVTARHNAREGQLAAPGDYFINNRVVALHTGLEMGLADWVFKLKLSYSWNYGTFATSPYGNTTGTIQHPSFGNFEKVKQLSGYFTAERKLSPNYFAGIDLAFDWGRLLDNSMGSILKVRRQF